MPEINDLISLIIHGDRAVPVAYAAPLDVVVSFIYSFTRGTTITSEQSNDNITKYRHREQTG